MFCQSCGKENPDGAAFCNSCGADTRLVPPRQPEPEPVPEPLECKSCGTTIQPGQQFCPNCLVKAPWPEHTVPKKQTATRPSSKEITLTQVAEGAIVFAVLGLLFGGIFGAVGGFIIGFIICYCLASIYELFRKK